MVNAMEKQLIPAGYKQTEVGVIPEDWDVCSMLEIAHLERGKFSARPRNDPKFFNGSIPFVQTGDITRSKGNCVSYTQTLNDEGVKVSRVFQENTLFFTIAANIGDVAIVPYSVACPDSLVAINTRPHISKFWLLQALRSRKKEFEMLATSNAQLNINLEKLNPYLLPVPNTQEQTAIANALSDVDALIVALEKLINKKSAIKTAAMQQLLTGKKRLPPFDQLNTGYKQTELGEIPRDWKLISLQNMAAPNGLVRGPFGGAIKKEHFTKTGYKVYEQRNAIYSNIEIGNYYIDQKKFDELTRFSVSSGDFIVSCSGTIGRIYQIPEKHPKGVINQALLKITLNDSIDSKYFCHYFKWDIFQERITDGTQGGAMKNLVGMAEFKQSLMPLPTLKREQTAIANVLSDMDKDLEALQQRLHKTQQIKQGMMQELLTGKTRLV